MAEIKIDEEKLNKIIKQNEELLEELKMRKTPVRDKKGKSIVRLKRYDNKLIIEKEDKLTSIRNKETGENELYVNVVLMDDNGKTSKKLARCLSIAEGIEVRAEVIKKTVTEKTDDRQILQPIQVIKHEDWRSVGTGAYVDNIVIIPHSIFELKLPDGKKITVDENVINI